MSFFAKSFKSIVSLSLGIRNTRNLVILIYHRVLDGPDFMYPETVDKSGFDAQMALLSLGFNVLPFGVALDLLAANKLPPLAVCITFDDGYADNYVNALPILTKYQLPAVFFVVSGKLDQDRMWNDDIVESVRLYAEATLDLREIGLNVYPTASPVDKLAAANKIIQSVKYLPIQQRDYCCRRIAELVDNLPKGLLLTTEQLEQLHQAGMEIGGHSVTHPILKDVPIEVWQYEIRENKRQLEQILDTPMRYFAYPNGKFDQDFDRQQIEFVEKCGYKAALSTNWGCATRQSELFNLPRFTPWDKDPRKFMLRLLAMFFGYNA